MGMIRKDKTSPMEVCASYFHNSANSNNGELILFWRVKFRVSSMLLFPFVFYKNSFAGRLTKLKVWLMRY